MFITNIVWLDKMNNEAIVEISDGKNVINCYGYKCRFSKGDVINDALEVLDISNIKISMEKKSYAISEAGSLKYILSGYLCNHRRMLVVGEIRLNINQDKIPGDILDGDYVTAEVSRIDLW